MNLFTSKNLNTVLSALGVIVVLGGLYWYFSGSTQSSVTALTESSAAGPSGSLFTLTSELSNVSFDTSLFSDPRFASLRDISTPVTPEPQGKSDPFAPASP